MIVVTSEFVCELKTEKNICHTLFSLNFAKNQETYFASFKFRDFERKLELECIKFRDFFSILQYVALTSEL